MSKFRLDELYRMTAYVYSEQNFHRPVSATFLHFVEVCGMLTALARKKKREDISFEDSLCKALGWFFPLMAKCGVRSVEKIIFRKFPYVCPYCRKCPHQDMDCKNVKGTASTVDHPSLRKKETENIEHMPKGLNDWQRMFQDIYARDPDHDRSAIGLMEELGELAEALRVFERHPRFLAGEAADTFSYIMGLANEYSIRKQVETEQAFDFEKEYLSRYPGLCLACGNPICTCPSVPAATIGRMAKELEIGPEEDLFSSHFYVKDGRELSAKVLKGVGGFDSIVSKLPVDKGQMSSSILVLCYRLADAIFEFDPHLSQKLKTYATKISLNQTSAGEKHSPNTPEDVISILAEALRIAVANDKDVEGLSDSLGLHLIKAASKFKVLMIGVSPIEDDVQLNVAKEARAIKQAIRLSKQSELIEFDELMSCTIDELRRQLLDKEYDLIHFFGHGFEGGVVLADSESESKEVRIDSLRALVQCHPTIKGVLLNSCDSLKGVEEPIAEFTIGMVDEIDDEHAISFAVGFYDAICTNSTVQRAIDEGQNNVRLQHNGATLPLKVLKREAKAH